jgi:hypothetical protein
MALTRATLTILPKAPKKLIPLPSEPVFPPPFKPIYAQVAQKEVLEISL